MDSFLNYLFDGTTPPFLPGTAQAVYIIIGILVAGALGARLIGIKQKEGLKKSFWIRASMLCGVAGILGLMFFFFRQQQVYLLGARVWMYGLAVIFAYRSVIMVRKFIKDIPAARERQMRENIQKKYIP